MTFAPIKGQCPVCRQDAGLNLDPIVSFSESKQLAELRARLERAEPIVAAARNLIEQKGRHNTEIAYKRLADAIAKERT